MTNPLSINSNVKNLSRINLNLVCNQFHNSRPQISLSLTLIHKCLFRSPESLKQFTPQKAFADRRKYGPVARTYFYLNEANCEKNMTTFLKCIDAVAGATHGTGLAAVKLTALGRPGIFCDICPSISSLNASFL